VSLKLTELKFSKHLFRKQVTESGPIGACSGRWSVILPPATPSDEPFSLTCYLACLLYLSSFS